MTNEPYYQDDLVTLHHGDCLDVLPTISGVDLVITSPPYNLSAAPWGHLGHYKQGDQTGSGKAWLGASKAGGGIAYDTHDDSMPWVEYESWQKKCLSAMWSALTDRGAIYYNHKPRVVGERVWLPTELNPGLPLRQVVIWARSGGMGYTPTAYMSTHEWVLVIAKPEFRLKSRGASGVGDVWSVPQQPNADHPAPFPIAIPARAIDTTEPKLVLDPFAGSGSTLIAASNAGVPSIGIEKSERYCELIARRLANQTMALDFSGETV